MVETRNILCIKDPSLPGGNYTFKDDTVLETTIVSDFTVDQLNEFLNSKGINKIRNVLVGRAESMNI